MTSPKRRRRTRGNVMPLCHGRFHSLKDKLEIVRAWPDVLQIVGGATAFDLALKEAQDRVARFQAESPRNPFLTIVVSPYGPTACETFLYGRAQIMAAFAGCYEEWKDAYAKGVDANRIRYLEGTPRFANCLRIEVMDCAAHFDPREGFIPRSVSGPKSAHMAVIFGVAEDPDWMMQADGITVPHIFVDGLELNIPGFDAWAYRPHLRGYGTCVELSGDHNEGVYFTSALPSLWK